MPKHKKGGQFEREICKELSLWWTGGERDDVFWRTAGSGGRATTRSKKGKGTAGACGDICASDPIGAPFLKVLTLELKRGYQGHNLHNLLDHNFRSSSKNKIEEFEVFLQQAIQSAKNAKSFSWGLIFRRDGRDAWIWFPYFVYYELGINGAFEESDSPFPFVHVHCKVRGATPADKEFVGMPLSEFTNQFQAKHFLQICKDYNL